MIHIEDISTDVLDITEQFVSKIVDNAPDNADAIMALRQNVVKSVAQYLCDDRLCGYDISKRLLLQSWNDHYPVAAEEDTNKSVWNAVIRYAATDQFSHLLKTINVSTKGHDQMNRDRNDVVRSLTAYCSHFAQHGGFNNFNYMQHLLCNGYLSEHANRSNSILLQQVAIHVLNRGKKSNATIETDAVVIDQPFDHIVHVISKAHACRQSLVEGLASGFAPRSTDTIEVQANEIAVEGASLNDFDLSTRKKAAP